MKDDRKKAMLFQRPEYIPVSLGVLPSAWIHYREELNAIAKRHPLLFGDWEEKRDYDMVSQPTYIEGEHRDVWGCIWSNVQQGQEAIVTHHPVPSREEVHRLEIPEEDAGTPHGFMYLRLGDLRGFEELMLDFAEEPPELQILIDKVLAYNQRQIAITLAGIQEEGRILYFGDDLGMQHSLPMSPEMWRKYLKPCYMALYKPVTDAGHYVYMHTDGHIYEIIPDLVDCGVRVINPQFRSNGLDNLIRVCKGKVCVDLDLDRQMFPFCSPKDIHDHIHESVDKLGDPVGGLWLKAEVDHGVPLENIEAICTALEKYRGYFR